MQGLLLEDDDAGKRYLVLWALVQGRCLPGNIPALPEKHFILTSRCQEILGISVSGALVKDVDISQH